MKISTVSEIKQQLSNASAKELLEICMRIIKYKKENKELVSFLLYEAQDLPAFIESIKNEMDEQFLQVNISNFYFAKKGLRKILKSTNRYIKYTQSKEAEAELLIYFCKKIKHSGIRISNSTALTNLYNNQLKKIKIAVATLHEDLQYDLNREIELIT